MVGLHDYVSQKVEIERTRSPLLMDILPFLSSLGVFMLLRTLASIFFFLVIPYRSVTLYRSIFMRLGGGLYANAKFPMM
jgi:hypothetical protein